MNLLYFPRYPLKKDYIDLEIWSETLNKSELKKHSTTLIEKMKEEFENIEVLKFVWSRELEIYRHLALAVYGLKKKGYWLRIKENVDPFELKNLCMSHEIDSEGNRVSDIDLYLHKDRKISRK